MCQDVLAAPTPFFISAVLYGSHLIPDVTFNATPTESLSLWSFSICFSSMLPDRQLHPHSNSEAYQFLDSFFAIVKGAGECGEDNYNP